MLCYVTLCWHMLQVRSVDDNGGSASHACNSHSDGCVRACMQLVVAIWVFAVHCMLVPHPLRGRWFLYSVGLLR
jgi:hypothetical protein